MLLSNERFDPFTETYSPITVTGEVHIIPNYAPFTVALTEVPKQASPSTVAIPDYTEVNAPPGPKEFRVDYAHRTGQIQFSAADAGNTVSISYQGVGSSALVDFLNQIASQEPQYVASQWWMFHEAGSHFHTMPDTLRWLNCSSWVLAASPACLHAAVPTAVNSGGAFHCEFFSARDMIAPGYGFAMGARFKTSINCIGAHAAGKVMAIGIGSLYNAVSASAADLTDVVALALPNGGVSSPYLHLLWLDTSTTLNTLNITPIRSLASYQNYTVDYTPGMLRAYYNTILVGSVGTYLNTSAFGGVSAFIRHPGTQSLGGVNTFQVFIDFLAAVPTGAWLSS